MNSNLTKLKMNQEVFLPNITGASKGNVEEIKKGKTNLYLVNFGYNSHWLTVEMVYNTAEEANNALLTDCKRECTYCPHKGKCTL